VRAGTEEWKEAFPTIGFKPDHVFVVPVSIRDDWLSESNGSLSTEPNILWLGKLRRYKCPDHIIRAMPAILDQVKAARLVIAGRRDDPDYEKELRDLAEQLGVQRSIAFRFDVSDSEKRRLIQESRVMVLPSAVEGFGIVVLEANAYGIPVVASSGVPEGAVRNGYNGLRFKFGNIEALAQNVVQLLQDPALYSTLSTNASSNAKRFSWSRVGAEFETVVRQASASAQSTR
jgi:glycosyltransferase involved in cell wall biosynthesis